MVVQIEEFNATGRSEKGKIKGWDKFNGQLPGRLTLSIRYASGVLEVHVQSAHQIFGKRSQDPYALVYLLDKNTTIGEKHAKTWFQENNIKTKTVDKTLDPVWNHSFKFVGVNDIVRKSLVVAIWDDDSTSRDDYLAGVRIPMEEVLYFDANKSLVTLDLQAQLADGHPGEIDQKTWRYIFGYIESGWDLKTCNNHLVTFIEKARVLAEAYEVDNMYPKTMTNKTSVRITATSMFDDELHKLKLKIQESRRNLEERRRVRDQLRLDNSSLKSSFERHSEEMKTHCSTACGLHFVVGRTFEREKRYDDVEVRHMGGSTIQSSRDTGYLERMIKIRTDYEARMKAELSKVRETYSVKYQEFIHRIQGHADEIMSLYEEIVRERAAKGPDYRNGLLAMESSRNYQMRINSLSVDIDTLNASIRALNDRLAGLRGLWEPQIREIEAMMDARKADMRKLLLELRQYAESRYNVTNEVAIYDKLLGFEESRISTHSQRKTVSVRSSSARHESHSMSSSSASGHEAHSMTSVSGGGGGMTYGYTSTSVSGGRRHLSSGYSSPSMS